MSRKDAWLGAVTLAVTLLGVVALAGNAILDRGLPWWLRIALVAGAYVAWKAHRWTVRTLAAEVRRQEENARRREESP